MFNYETGDGGMVTSNILNCGILNFKPSKLMQLTANKSISETVETGRSNLVRTGLVDQPKPGED